MNTSIFRKAIPPGARVRVLVVDDSVVIRRLVTHALSADPALEVVGAASNGVIALERIAQSKPDAIHLVTEMAEMDGLAFLLLIRRPPRSTLLPFPTLFRAQSHGGRAHR